MFLSNPCEDDESLCNWVYDQTDTHEAANLADWLIGLPLAIIGLVALGLVIRFVLHRLVDRLVARAEGGVLPGQGRQVLAAPDVPRTRPTPRSCATWPPPPAGCSAPRPWATCSRASSPAS